MWIQAWSVGIVLFFCDQRVWGQEFAGSESCSQCHEKASGYWESKMGRTRSEGAECATCHMSQLSATVKEEGVACERCHGPASAHASSNGGSGVRRPSKLAPAERDATCAQCHSEGGGGHVAALAASKCKVASGDRLWCNSCHDPHRTIGVAERDSHYRPKCRTCHAKAHADVTDRSDCLGCHMPKRDVAAVPHGVRTDHSIPRVLKSGSGPPRR